MHSLLLGLDSTGKSIANNEQSVVKGVADAWDFYWSQHPVSTWECIENAIEKAMKLCLDEHKDEIITAIAKRQSSSEGG